MFVSVKLALMSKCEWVFCRESERACRIPPPLDRPNATIPVVEVRFFVFTCLARTIPNRRRAQQIRACTLSGCSCRRVCLPPADYEEQLGESEVFYTSGELHGNREGHEERMSERTTSATGEEQVGDGEVVYTTGELHEHRSGHGTTSSCSDSNDRGTEVTAIYSDSNGNGIDHGYVSENGGSKSSGSARALKELGREFARDIAGAAGDAMDRAIQHSFDASLYSTPRRMITGPWPPWLRAAATRLGVAMDRARLRRTPMSLLRALGHRPRHRHNRVEARDRAGS